jgi:hypothetical protein
VAPKTLTASCACQGQLTGRTKRKEKQGECRGFNELLGGFIEAIDQSKTYFCFI